LPTRITLFLAKNLEKWSNPKPLNIDYLLMVVQVTLLVNIPILEQNPNWRRFYFQNHDNLIPKYEQTNSKNR